MDPAEKRIIKAKNCNFIIQFFIRFAKHISNSIELIVLSKIFEIITLIAVILNCFTIVFTTGSDHK